MGTLIHAVAHGLAADDTIMLGNLVGGEGLEENTLYYVLAAGLTADDFAVSETSGGTAIVYTTDITDGVIVRTDTYEAVSDGVMDPPTTPAAPGDPVVLTSIEVSGVVRLYVEVPGYEDTATRVRTSEVTVTHNYSGGLPVWESGQVLNLPQGVTNMSIPALGGTLYAARWRVQDVFGNFSDYSATSELTTDPGVDALVPADDSITNTKIATDAVRANHIKAGEITANKLAATLLLASLIQTAESGRRIELDVDGIRLYDASDGLLVRIPTNGDPVYVKGEVNADSLISQTSAEFRTAASLAGNATMTLQTGISAPTTAPSLAASVDSNTLTSTPGSVAASAGIAYDSTGDSGNGSYWIACDPTVSPYYVAQEFAATSSTGTAWRLLRSISATGSTTTVTTTAGSTSHVSDTADATSGASDDQVATPITMPRDGRITKVSFYATGYGGTCDVKGAVWNSAGTLRASTATQTMPSEALGTGNSNHYNLALTSPYTATGGQTYRVGFYRTSSADGFQWDKDDGTGKTTYIGDGGAGDLSGVTTDSNSKPNVYITYEYDVDTRLETATNIGIATDGTYLYTLDSTGTIWQYLLSDGSYVASLDVSGYFAASVPTANAGLYYDSNYNRVVVTTFSTSGAAYLRTIHVSPVSFTYTSTVDGSTTTVGTGATSKARGGAYAETYRWVVVDGVVKKFDSGYVYQSDHDFGTAATCSEGVTHDGTYFRGYDSASPTKVWKFSNWDFSTASTTLWVGYSWYDSIATTHETVMGPRASLTIRRRERVQVTIPAVPTGGTDDPNNARIYALQNATDTGAGTFWLQYTTSSTSTYMTSYTGSGTADFVTTGGGRTAFSAGTPAELKSAATGWSLKGDGSASFGALTATGKVTASGLQAVGGSSFPGSPSTNDRFYRTDYGMEFYYDGTRWLSTELFVVRGGGYSTSGTYAITLSATASAVQRASMNVGKGTDIYLVDLTTTNFVNSGGTALSASHKWVSTLNKVDTGNTPTAIGSTSIDSGSSSFWHTKTTALNTLLGTYATYPHLRLDWTKTGTPGTLQIEPGFQVTYRVVAT